MLAVWFKHASKTSDVLTTRQGHTITQLDGPAAQADVCGLHKAQHRRRPHKGPGSLCPVTAFYHQPDTAHLHGPWQGSRPQQVLHATLRSHKGGVHARKQYTHHP